MIKIVKVKLKDITLYENNPKSHTTESTKNLRKSIEQFGYNAPIGIHGDNNEVVFGHGRVKAFREMYSEDYEVECVKIDNLSDEQIKELRLVENSTQMATGFDEVLYNKNLDNIFNIDMGDFGITKKLPKLGNPEDKVCCPACGLEYDANKSIEKE